jgi:hypothetical protein
MLFAYELPLEDLLQLWSKTVLELIVVALIEQWPQVYEKLIQFISSKGLLVAIDGYFNGLHICQLNHPLNQA